MRNSPCAKLTTSMMPKISVKPDATSARIMPLTMPFSVWMTKCANEIMSYAEILVDDRVADAQLRGRGVVAHDALLDDVDPLAGKEGQRHILLDQQHRHRIAVQHLDDLPYLRHHARHQPFGRFVEEHDFRLEHHRPGDRQHLLLAPRQRAAGLAPPLG